MQFLPSFFGFPGCYFLSLFCPIFHVFDSSRFDLYSWVKKEDNILYFIMWKVVEKVNKTICRNLFPVAFIYGSLKQSGRCLTSTLFMKCSPLSTGKKFSIMKAANKSGTAWVLLRGRWIVTGNGGCSISKQYLEFIRNRAYHVMIYGDFPPWNISSKYLWQQCYTVHLLNFSLWKNKVKQ